jgi:hypothetical protein
MSDSQKKFALVAVVYLFGCVLMYFGIAASIIDFMGSGKWKYQPEPDIASSLLNAAVFLIRPFLAVVVLGWALIIPIGLAFWVCMWSRDAFSFLRRLIRRK